MNWNEKTVRIYINDSRELFNSLYLELDATQYELAFSMDWQRWDNKKNSGIIYYIGIRLYKHENYGELNCLISYIEYDLELGPPLINLRLS